MANFFRDSSMGFKPRTNIFNKLKVKETSNDKEGTKDEGAEHIDLGSPGNLSLTEDESDTSIANTLMLVAHDSGLSNETLQDQTSVSDISRLGESNNNKLFMNSSTPRTMNNFHTKESKQQIKNGTEGDTDDDEDFEITEVRNVEVPKTKQPPFLPEKNYVVENEVDRKNSGLSIVLQGKGISDSNSNDVLLEAFTNTQRICSNLKQELQRQQTENSKLKINLNTYENDFHKVSLKVDTFKNLLTKLEENGKVLLTQKDLDSEKISCLTKDYDLSKKRIMGFREDILTLRNQLNKLQDYKRNTDMELTKKSKEIEYLKRELDDCSGQLSEEKIRNGALTNEFGVLKEEIFKKLEVQVKLTDENIKEFISSNKLELYRDLQDFLTQQFKNEKALAFEKIDHSTLDITKSLETNTTSLVNITKQFETTSINESNKIREHCNNMKRNILENLGLWGTEIKLRLEDDGSEIKMVTKSISEQVKLQNVSFVDQIKKIETMMEEYQVKLIQVEDFEKSIKALEIENSSLQQQVTENMSLIGMKEAQFEEKSLALANVTIELSKIKSGNDELAQSLKEKQERFEIVEKELQISQDLLDSERANFENKLVSQNEINSAMSTENEILKSRIKELENYKETWERDQDGRIDKLQKINEQFQKLNVESVQLKAHELELEEENRNLRRAIELNEESVQDNSRELSLLRQQMIGFTAERQEMTADKLKQQDKNEELQEIIKQLRKEVSRLKTSIEKYKESERKEKQKPALPTHQNQNNKQIKETPKPKLKSRERGDSIILQTQSTQEKPVSKTNKSAKEMVRITTSTKENPNKGVKEQRKEVNTANDDFDLSGSSNDDFDDLELTNSSPIFLKPIASKVRTNGKRDTRKKLLLYDESEDGAHASKGGNLNKRRKR